MGHNSDLVKSYRAWCMNWLCGMAIAQDLVRRLNVAVDRNGVILLTFLSPTLKENENRRCLLNTKSVHCVPEKNGMTTIQNIQLQNILGPSRYR
jgi:hypothetical protein